MLVPAALSLPFSHTHTHTSDAKKCGSGWLYFGNSQISSVKQNGMITESTAKKKGVIMMYDSVVSSDLASASGGHFWLSV